MDIEDLNADKRQNPTSQIRGRRIIHLTTHVPSVASLDIKVRILGLTYIQRIRQRIKAKEKEMWTLSK